MCLGWGLRICISKRWGVGGQALRTTGQKKERVNEVNRTVVGRGLTGSPPGGAEKRKIISPFKAQEERLERGVWAGQADVSTLAPDYLVKTLTQSRRPCQGVRV